MSNSRRGFTTEALQTLSLTMHGPANSHANAAEAPARSNEDRPPTTQEIEVAKLQLFLMKNLPKANLSLLQELSKFLLAATPQTLDWKKIDQQRYTASQRNSWATNLAERLIASGFGTPKQISMNEKAVKSLLKGNIDIDNFSELPMPNRVLNLAALLLKAPAFTETTAPSTFRLEFSDWKTEFVAALQARNTFVGEGR